MTGRSIVLRTPSGLSGDMLVTGLARLAGASDEELDAIAAAVGMPELLGAIRVLPHSVRAIAGWKARVDLPHEHHHRTLSRILELLDASALSDEGKALARETFTLLGRAEAAIHGVALADVTFHEVGALDSILDIGLAAELFARLAPANLYCSPLPLCDGTIICDHGPLASPAPAVQELLRGVPVYGIKSSGETVTPTAIAFLRAAQARFGIWPAARIEEVARVYGGRELPGVPNGAIFFLVQE